MDDGTNEKPKVDVVKGCVGLFVFGLLAVIAVNQAVELLINLGVWHR